MDAHIQAYYAHQLGMMLEARYQEPFGSSVLAYRRFPDKRCNIHFALDAIEEVRRLGNCEVIALDVSGFFDSFSHSVLKAAWCRLLAYERLPGDHFAVFQSVVADSAIRLDRIRDVLGETRSRTGADGARICTPTQLRSQLRAHLKPRYQLVCEIKGEAVPPAPRGVAQGTPISAVLSNIYMLECDEMLHDELERIGASYRRYCDDILIIAPPGFGEVAERLVAERLASLDLSINASKTAKVAFSWGDGNLLCLDLATTSRSATLDYLGISFDGRNIRLRDSTISRFAKKMIKGVWVARREAGKQNAPLKRRKLFSLYSSKGTGNAYSIDATSRPRPGFHGYLTRAAVLTESDAILRQGRQLDGMLERLVARRRKDPST